MDLLQGLYAITAERMSSEQILITQVEQAICGGARLVQYRSKDPDTQRQFAESKALLKLCQAYHISLIINDNIDLALAIGANGVHLGRNDVDPKLARQRLGPKFLIGVSCYNSLDRAEKAQGAGASYVAFGSFFPSITKPLAVKAELELLRLAKQRITLPIVAIGGINLDNGNSLIAAGADMLAVISSLFRYEDIQSTARSFASLFTNR